MKEERHSFSDPRPLLNSNNDSSSSLPTWQVDVFREGVPEAVLTLLINNETFPPRVRKNKVVWKLPETIDELPRFGTEDKRRLLDLFKHQKKEQRKGKVVVAAAATTKNDSNDAFLDDTNNNDSKSPIHPSRNEGENQDMTTKSFNNSSENSLGPSTIQSIAVAPTTPAATIAPAVISPSTPQQRTVLAPPPGLAPRPPTPAAPTTPQPPLPPPGFAQHVPHSPAASSSSLSAAVAQSSSSPSFHHRNSVTSNTSFSSALPVSDHLSSNSNNSRRHSYSPSSGASTNKGEVTTTKMTTSSSNLEIHSSSSSSNSSSLPPLPQHQQQQQQQHQLSGPPTPLSRPEVASLPKPRPPEPGLYFRGPTLQDVLQQVEDLFYSPPPPDVVATTAPSSNTTTAPSSSSSPLPPLYLYYSLDAQKSVSVGGVFVSCTNRSELCRQVVSLQQSMTLQNKTWITNRLVQTIGGSSGSGNSDDNTNLLLLVLTGKTLPPPLPPSQQQKASDVDPIASAWPFSHSLLLVATPSTWASTPGDDDDNNEVTPHAYQYQIQNDILCLFPTNT